MKQTHKIFVYGTLKRPYYNHRLLATAKFLGVACTVDKFNMIDVGFPVLLPQFGGVAFPVKGELYEVDDATLERLDQLEGEGRMYQRQTRAVHLLTDNEPKLQHAYLYVGMTNAAGRWGGAHEVDPVAGDQYIDEHYDWQPQPRSFDEDNDDNMENYDDEETDDE